MAVPRTATLKIVKRKEPFAMITIRIPPGDKACVEKVATENDATVTDVIMSALVQTGVIPGGEAKNKKPGEQTRWRKEGKARRCQAY